MQMRNFNQTMSPFEHRPPISQNTPLNVKQIASRVLRYKKLKNRLDNHFSPNPRFQYNFSPQPLFNKKNKNQDNQRCFSPNITEKNKFWDSNTIHDSEQRQQRLCNDIKSIEEILHNEYYSNTTKSKFKRIKESEKVVTNYSRLIHSPIQSLRTKCFDNLSYDTGMSCFDVRKAPFQPRLLSPTVAPRLIL